MGLLSPLGGRTQQCSMQSENTPIPSLLKSWHMSSLLSVAVHESRFVENIPCHITPKSRFESFAEYTQCVQEGPFRLEATADTCRGGSVCTTCAGGHPVVLLSPGRMHVRYTLCLVCSVRLSYSHISLPPLPTAMLQQVLLTTSPIVCSALNATVAFTLVALVRIVHVYLAPGALRLCVVLWIFHPVLQLPLLQGFFFFFFYFV